MAIASAARLICNCSKQLYISIHVQGSEDPAKVESIKAGSHFGEETVMFGTQRASTMHAATNAIVYEIAKDQMKEILVRRGDLLSMLNEDIAVSSNKITTREKAAIHKRKAPAKEEGPKSKMYKAAQTFFNFF